MLKTAILISMMAFAEGRRYYCGMKKSDVAGTSPHGNHIARQAKFPNVGLDLPPLPFPLPSPFPPFFPSFPLPSPFPPFFPSFDPLITFLSPAQMRPISCAHLDHARITPRVVLLSRMYQCRLIASNYGTYRMIG